MKAKVLTATRVILLLTIVGLSSFSRALSQDVNLPRLLRNHDMICLREAHHGVESINEWKVQQIKKVDPDSVSILIESPLVSSIADLLVSGGGAYHYPHTNTTAVTRGLKDYQVYGFDLQEDYR